MRYLTDVVLAALVLGVAVLAILRTGAANRDRDPERRLHLPVPGLYRFGSEVVE